MITKQDPTQLLLLSRFRNLLSVPALKALDEGWQGVFHRMILRQLPVQKIEKDFNPVTGRPRKIYTTEEQIGYDIEKLIRQFSGDPRFVNMASYKDRSAYSASSSLIMTARLS